LKGSNTENGSAPLSSSIGVLLDEEDKAPEKHHEATENAEEAG